MAFDLADLDHGSLRDRMLVEPHAVHLFGDTVGAALDTGAVRADGDIGKAVEAAALGELADRLGGDLLDHELLDHGSNLSGGQRQRVALARALLADRPILVLRDPTTAVDGVTEQRIADGLAALRRGDERATLVISTSPPLLSRCDRVVYVDGGRMVAVGTHAELLARSDYAERCSMTARVSRVRRRDPAGRVRAGDRPGVLAAGQRRTAGWRSGSVLSSVAASVAAVLVPILLGRIVDLVNDHGSGTELVRLVVAIAAAGLAAGILTAVSRYLVSRLGAEVCADLREDVMDDALRMDSARLEAAGAGDVASRVTEDVDRITASIRLAANVFAALVTVVVTVAGFASLDWRIALAFFAVVPVYVVAIRLFLPQGPPVVRGSTGGPPPSGPRAC